MGFFKKLLGKNKSALPASNPVEKIVKHDFPVEQQQEVLKILNSFRWLGSDREVAQKMILKEAKGNVEKLKKYAEIANQVQCDYRDLAGELQSLRPRPCKGKNHHLCNGKVALNYYAESGETSGVCFRCGEKYDHKRLVENNLLTPPYVSTVCNCEICGTCGRKYLPSGTCPCIHRS